MLHHLTVLVSWHDNGLHIGASGLVATNMSVTGLRPLTVLSRGCPDFIPWGLVDKVRFEFDLSPLLSAKFSHTWVLPSHSLKLESACLSRYSVWLRTGLVFQSPLIKYPLKCV
jgi:hypothetical protein